MNKIIKRDTQEKERITILVSEATKNRWQDFSKKKDYSTLSKLLRESVEFFIDSSFKPDLMETIIKLTHDLKEPLTAIKGFSQLLIENHKDKLEWSTLSKIKEVFDQSLILEEIIKNTLDQYQHGRGQYDILIVDDEPTTNKVLVEYCRSKGYSCFDVTSGNAALKELEEVTPKVILLDILLPDISGYDICKQIKSTEILKNIPIFYITALPDYEVKLKMKKTLANGYFLKPFNFSEFEAITEYL